VRLGTQRGLRDLHPRDAAQRRVKRADLSDDAGCLGAIPNRRLSERLWGKPVLAGMGRPVRPPRLLRVRLSVGGPVLQLLREVSHGSLLIRSPRGPDTGTNVDLAFSGVEYVACPWLMRGLELAQAGSADLRRVHRRAWCLKIRTRSSFSCRARPLLVVASSCLVSENTGLIAQPGITERDEIRCILNVVCAEVADGCFHDTPERGAVLHGPAAGQGGWGVRGSNPEPTD
jgi:hypothetical protein